MICTHGENGLYGTTEFGGRKYKTVNIGGKVLLAENLNYIFDGLVVGGSGTSSTVPMAKYYDNDPNNGDVYGLLYTGFAVLYLNEHRSELIPGWHVPSLTEMQSIVNFFGGTIDGNAKLKSINLWKNGANGNNISRLDIRPAGYWSSGSNFNGLSETARFNLSTVSTPDNTWTMQISWNSSEVQFRDLGVTALRSVRLVKD